MKGRFLILVSFFTLSVLKGQTVFQKIYDGGATSDFGRSVQQTVDGGFIITGQTSLGAGPSDMYLVKTDYDGTIQWAKTFGGPGNEIGYCVRQTSDGGFIILGNTDTYVSGGPWDMYLVKTTSNGTFQWSKTFGGTGIEEGRSVQETSDGGFIITGNTTSVGMGDIYLVKTTFNGTLQWTKTYGYLSGNDFGEAVKQTNDGGYIITGFTSRESNHFDVYLVKTAYDGTLEWTKTFGDTLDDRGYDVQQTNDGGFVIAGTFGKSVPISGGTQYYGDVYLIKTASDGTLQWNKTFGNTNHAIGYSVQETSDGGYIIGAERSGAYLLKTASNGTLQWSKIYGNLLGGGGITSAQQTSDGGYTIVGTISNSGTFDVYLIKTDGAGNSGCNETNPTTIVSSGGMQGTGGIQGTVGALTGNIATQTFSGGSETTLCLVLGVNEITEQHSVSIFPNPFSTQMNLHTDNYFNDATLVIYNSFGQLVRQIKNISGETVTIFRENLSSGVYFMRLIQDNKIIFVNKLVITD